MAFLGLGAMEGLVAAEEGGALSSSSRFLGGSSGLFSGASKLFTSHNIMNGVTIMSTITKTSYSILSSTEGMVISAITGLLTIISIMKKK